MLFAQCDEQDGSAKIDNVLEKTCEEMEATISRNVQNNLDKLEEDCRTVGDKIDHLLEADAAARKENRKRAFYGSLCSLISLILPLVSLGYFVDRTAPEPLLEHAPQLVSVLGHLSAFVVIEASEAANAAARAAHARAVSAAAAAADPTADGALATEAPPPHLVAPGLLTMQQLLLGSAATFLAFQILSKLFRRYKKTFGYRELANMRQTKKHVMGKLLREKENSYKIYLDQCRSPCGY